MTERNIDDVTGKMIEGGRSFKLQGQGGMYMDPGICETQDVDALLAILRDKLTGKRASPPLEIIIQSWEHSPLNTSYRQYAPVQDEEEPAPAPAPAPDDAPFGPIRTTPYPFPIPLPDSIRPFAYLNRDRVLWPVPKPTPKFYPGADTAPSRAQKERAEKLRGKYVASLAAMCGCNDPTAHEGSVFKP
jgi:hypothetical protein